MKSLLGLRIRRPKAIKSIFLRDRDGHEIDFLLTKQQHPLIAIEAKASDSAPAAAFKKFCLQLGLTRAVQLVLAPDPERSFPFGLDVVEAAGWLKKLDF